jgi:hypothetical protein
MFVYVLARFLKKIFQYVYYVTNYSIDQLVSCFLLRRCRNLLIAHG